MAPSSLVVADAIRERDTPRAAQAFLTLQSADPTNPNLEKLRDELLTLSRSKAPKPP